MEKFDIEKIKRQLRKINKDSNIKVDAGIQLISNNLFMYNNLVDEYLTGNIKNVYLMYQLNGTIFKELDKYNIFPSKELSISYGNKEDYPLNKLKKDIEYR